MAKERFGVLSKKGPGFNGYVVNKRRRYDDKSVTASYLPTPSRVSVIPRFCLLYYRLRMECWRQTPGAFSTIDVRPILQNQFK